MFDLNNIKGVHYYQNKHLVFCIVRPCKITQFTVLKTKLCIRPQMYTTSIMINAPETFVPVPVEEKAAPKPQPPAVPPKPFKDTRVFQNVDTHAVEVICRAQYL